jgi:hypothetical protein
MDPDTDDTAASKERRGKDVLGDSRSVFDD